MAAQRYHLDFHEAVQRQPRQDVVERVVVSNIEDADILVLPDHTPDVRPST